VAQAFDAIVIKTRADDVIEYSCGNLRPKRRAEREGDMMISGATVLFAALAILVVIWILVLWGSRYFGPADH
jgi:hypothetical protein